MARGRSDRPRAVDLMNQLIINPQGGDADPDQLVVNKEPSLYQNTRLMQPGCRWRATSSRTTHMRKFLELIPNLV